MVRTKDYKLIEYDVSGKKATQLFKIDEDKLEMNNLATKPEMASKITELRKQYDLAKAEQIFLPPKAPKKSKCKKNKKNKNKKGKKKAH